MIIFYPVMCVLFSIVMVLITLLYPCLRNTYHHGVYDPYDIGMSNVSLFYMNVICSIWSR